MKHRNYIEVEKLEKRIIIFKNIYILINPEPEDKNKRWYNEAITPELITKIKNWDRKHNRIRNSYLVRLENEIINWEQLEIETIRHEDTLSNYNIAINSPYTPLTDIKPEITQISLSTQKQSRKLHFIKVKVKWTHIYKPEEE